MTYIVDDKNLDAFGRLRVSDTDQRLDVEFLYDKQEEYFDEITNGASAAVTHNANTRDLTMSVGTATDAEYATMASYPVPYTPGNSQLIDITGVLDLAAIGSGTAEVFLRSSITGSVVEETIEQSNWSNLTSGVDWTKSHIFSMDFQSLKVGTIKYYMVQNGAAIKIAQINNDNKRDSGYWQIPNLPVYYKIYNTATETIMEMGYGDDNNGIGIRYKIAANASATMKAICCTVKSEGGGDLRDMAGLPRSIDMGVTEKTVSTTLIPLISIRPKSTFQSLDNLILSIPKGFSITTDNPIRLAIIHDCTLTGASWVDVDADESSIEYDITATAITNGHVVYSDYVATARNADTGDKGLLGKTILWNRKSTESGILTIAAIRTGTSDGSCLAALQWEELK